VVTSALPLELADGIDRDLHGDVGRRPDCNCCSCDEESLTSASVTFGNAGFVGPQ